MAAFHIIHVRCESSLLKRGDSRAKVVEEHTADLLACVCHSIPGKLILVQCGWEHWPRLTVLGFAQILEKKGKPIRLLLPNLCYTV